MKTRIRCERCLWWDISTSSSISDDETGLCRRKAPGFDDRTGLAVFPFTTETDWCGDATVNPDYSDEGNK